ncbi:MAG: DNA-binding protein [Candidatus Methylomirabilota bacterium]|nr:MAG: DNA-binding protein [candidate division NC10 bacterium]
MTTKPVPCDVQAIELRILTIRGQKVILDRDLAALYGVPTFRFNEAVKRNRKRFPDDFAFQLTRQELTDLISHIAISSSRHGGVRKLPWAFTEHGAVMAANILHSERAVQMSVFVVRAFVKMRAVLTTQKDLPGKLAILEKTLTERLDLHERVITDIIQQIMSLLSPPSVPEPPEKRIGFHVRDSLATYKRRRSVGANRVDGKAKP